MADALYAPSPPVIPTDLAAPHPDDRTRVKLVLASLALFLLLYLGLLKADRLRLPALTNMTAGAPLGRFLYDKPLVGEFGITSRSISGTKITKLKR
jgi:hypothetical protein